MADRFLLMWLEGPMQSWGSDSRYGRRETQFFPTKSGISGLLLSALGAGGRQTELLKVLSAARMDVIAYQYTRDKQVLAEKPELLRDYQVTGNGYDSKDAWQKLQVPKTVDGQAVVGGGTKITSRYYLQDAVFAVILQLPENQADVFSAALQDPVWTVFLGRKNCIPTEWIYQGCFSSTDEAREKAAELVKQKRDDESGLKLAVFAEIADGFDGEGQELTVSDVPLEFGLFKQYGRRSIAYIDCREGTDAE